MAGRLWWLQVYITCFDAFLSSPAPIGQIIFALEIGRAPWLLFCQVSSSRKKSANQIKEISCGLSLVDWTASAQDVTLPCPQGWPSSHCGQRHPVRHPNKLYLKVPVTSECLNTNHVKMTGCFVQCLLPYDIDDIDAVFFWKSDGAVRFQIWSTQRPSKRSVCHLSQSTI